MSERRSALVVGLSVFLTALALRTGHLYWSPYPSTLDGFKYAAQARDTIAAGAIPLGTFRADNFVFANGLTMTSTVTGLPPLQLAQPWIAVLGSASCVVAVAIARRLGTRVLDRRRRVRVAMLAVGYGVAIEGLYLRRTSVPDEETIALLLLPIAAIGLYRWLRTERTAWGIATGVVLLALPMTHTFSTLMTGLTLLGVLAAGAMTTLSGRRLAVGTAAVAGFWGYFIVYYEIAERTVLNVPYVGRVTAHPGLFLAWLVVFGLGLVWVVRRGRHAKRVALLAPVLLGFGVLVANAIQPIFPGTVRSPLPIVGLVLLLLLPVGLAGWVFPAVVDEPTSGPVLVALIGAPIVQTYFSLTAALTPEFFGTVMRTQTFAHLPVLVMAGVGTAALWRRDSGKSHSAFPVGRLALLGLLLVAVVTAPLAFVDLGTLAVPGTTTSQEFAAATFATTHLDEPVATDFNLDRITAHYYDGGTTIAPTATWLRGGPPPTCPVLANRKWTTAGGNFFPTGPATIDPARYRRWIARNDRVYAIAGYESLTVVLPRSPTGAGC